MRHSGMRGGFSPGRCGEFSHAAPSPSQRRARGFGSPTMKVPKSVPLAFFLGMSWRVPALCAPRGMRGAARLRLPTAERTRLGRLCAPRGGSESRGVCLCAEERAISQNSFFPLLFFFFFLSIFFSEEAVAGLPGMNEISFQGFSRVTFTLSV